MTVAILINDIYDIIASCPWLWWLGVSPGLRNPNRRAADRSIMLKLGSVLVVPLLTAAGAFLASWYGMRSSLAVMEERVSLYMHYNDEKQREHDQRIRDLERRLDGRGTE